ncbi:MAG: peptidylprolyl isomerase [Prochloraceae cyanobacterium]
MNARLKIGEQIIDSESLLSRLAQYQMIPQLAKEIIIEQATAEIECTPEEGNLARQQFCQQQQIATEDQLEAWKKQHWMDSEQLKKRMLLPLKLAKFKQAQWGLQLESEFLQKKAQLDKAIYSLIRTKDVGIAQELYFRLQEQENSFTELAKTYSQGPEANTGGLIGPVELGSIHPKLAQMLSNSRSGQVLPLNRLGEWIVIARLEKLIPAQLNEQVSQRLLEEKFQAWLLEQMQQQVSVEQGDWLLGDLEQKVSLETEEP